MEQIFYELFYGLPRLAPGSKEETLKAFNLLPLVNEDLKVLDLGCGTGMQTINLAEVVEGKITAIDNHQPFLNVLQERANQQNLSHKIEVKVGDITNLNESKNYYDLIWAEGAIYIIGLNKALSCLRQFLKPQGFLVFSELVWLEKSPPLEAKVFWEEEYPDMETLEDNLKLINSHNYKLIDNFPLPKSAWLDNYYLPLEASLIKAKEKYKDNQLVNQFIAQNQKEIEIFRLYNNSYNYVFFLLQNQS
jgi:ubiquinone/menaquinone biosynthesis C-methylase UbiE